MADTVRIKRRAGGAPGAPTSLANAELAYNETDDTLYYGKGTGGAGGSATTVVPIAGSGVASSALPAMNGAAAAGSATTLSRGDHIHPSDTSRAPLASPAFTGTPTAPTAGSGTNTTQLATTAYVRQTSHDQLTVPAADVPWNAKKITGLADPSAAQDAATKQYVDNVAQGLDAKQSCVLATTANITLTGQQTIDGVLTPGGERILVKNQTTATENGIYSSSIGAWVRTPDADVLTELVSAYVFIEQGTTNADSGWLCTVDLTGALGTTAVTWVQFSGGGSITAGTGLTKTGNTLDAVGTANRITANADSLDIAATYVGQTSITTLGTITTGIWNATALNVPQGGTGAVSLTGYVKGAGTSALTASATIPVADITGLGSMATQNASAVAITGGSIDGITIDGGVF